MVEMVKKRMVERAIFFTGLAKSNFSFLEISESFWSWPRGFYLGVSNCT